MNYLLDTLVVSEYIRRKPVKSVIDWLDDQIESSLYLSSLTIAELKKGSYKLSYSSKKSESNRAKKIDDWIMKLEKRFEDRIIPVNESVLDTWASLCGQAESEGRKLPVVDSLLVATAERGNFVIVTRNVADFKNCKATVELYDPYS